MMSDDLSPYPVPALADNYIWTLLRRQSGKALIVDPGEAQPVLDWLGDVDARLSAILITHHHPDHTHGIEALVAATGAPVYGPAREQQPIAGLTRRFSGGEHFTIEDMELSFETLHVPGHTLGAIAYLGHGCLFSGDTLFTAGCGRIFEGDPPMMYDSLQRLGALPADTLLCCGHEYTVNNLAFAAAVEPENTDIVNAQKRASERLATGQASLPTRLGDEHLHNPFLRSHLPAVQNAVAWQLSQTPRDSIECFAGLRQWKDHFKA